MINRRRTSHAAVDAVALIVLLLVGVWGFDPIFDGTGFLIAGIGGVLLGAAVAILAAWRRWGFPLIFVVAFTLYLLLGGALALRSTTASGGIPTFDSIQALLAGLVTSWKDLLTVAVPTTGVEEVLLVPFICALVCSTIAVSLGLRLRRPGWALVPAVLLLALSVAFGSYQLASPVAQGAVFTSVSVAWYSWRRAQARVEGASPLEEASSSATSRPGRPRILRGVALLCVAVTVGTLGNAAFASEGQRVVLRDEVTPPLEIRDYPSPLQSFRKYVRDNKEVTLFTVNGLPAGARIRLATLDMFDGTVYAVTGNGSAVSGSFTRADGVIAAPLAGEEITVTVSIGALRGVWVPDAGQVTSFDFMGDRAETLADGLYYNQNSGTAVATAGLAEGDSYTFTAVLPEEPQLAALGEVNVASIPLATFTDVPDSARDVAIDTVGAVSTPAAQVALLVERLSGGGYFSHGLEGQVPSRSGHGSERIASLLGSEQMIGDDEQYAVAFALMAHELGIPARVVVGFYPDTPPADGTFEANGDTIHVWAEVAFEDFGWVAVDPTPAEDRTPPDLEENPKREPKPQVLQPPPPPEEPAKAPPSLPSEDQAIEESSFSTENLLGFLAVLGAFLGGLVLLASPVLVILGLKLRRRSRRRHARVMSDRFSGGWEEVADAARDFGVVASRRATRRERSHVVEDAFPDVGAIALAAEADAGVWAPEEPTTEQSEAFWVEVDRSLGSIRGSRSRGKQYLALLSLRSFTKDKLDNTAGARPGALKGANR